MKNDLARPSVYLPFTDIFESGEIGDKNEEVVESVMTGDDVFLDRFKTIFEEHIEGFGIIRAKTNNHQMEWKKRLVEKREHEKKVQERKGSKRRKHGEELKQRSSSRSEVANRTKQVGAVSQMQRKVVIERYRQLMKSKRSLVSKKGGGAKHPQNKPKSRT